MPRRVDHLQPIHAPLQRNKLSPMTKPDDNVKHDALTPVALAELEDRLKAHLRELDARLTARLDDIDERIEEKK
jgi:hypothetical protein